MSRDYAYGKREYKFKKKRLLFEMWKEVPRMEELTSLITDQKQEWHLKRLNTLGGLEIGIQDQIVNALEPPPPTPTHRVHPPPPPPPPKKKKKKKN